MPALIELTEITKDYGKFRALDHVSLKIESGVTGLLGPNGAGKTTLIKVLLGLVRTTSGQRAPGSGPTSTGAGGRSGSTWSALTVPHRP